MKFQCFYVSATRWRFCKFIRNANNLWQHEALKGTNVHEMALCVTFGAPPFGTHFRLLTRCLRYARNHTLSGTHVPQTTLGVTFGARPRSIPRSLLGSLCGHLGHQGRPSTPEGFRPAIFWAANFAHRRRMKWPDDIGREAGNGRTRDGKKLTIFRACP